MIAKFSVAMLIAIAPVAVAQSLAGRWDATVQVSGVDIPFRFELSGDKTNVKGSFFNGDERITSTSGSFENGALVLKWDDHASKLDATFRDGVLEGKYIRAGRDEKSTYPFSAKRYSSPTAVKGDVPSIAGMWVIPTDSPKGEKAWRFIVRQTGSEVSAAVLRIDGDTGALTGTYKDGKFVLSHFDSARPMLLVVTPQKDGTLELLENSKTQRTAVRWEVAHAKGLPEPTDPMKHTSVKDASEPYKFRFPDLNGQMVSNTDPKFHGKVVLVDITGSWCPNCHDEAPFLSELYKKYRNQGLEIVALSFEEADQLKDLARLRAFIKRYDIQYTVLVGGEPSEAKDKLTQAVNWNSWPTTFFIGRDGLVRGVHAGFPSSASGDLHRQTKDEFTAEVQYLLSENQRTAR
ncbi:MAG TPA: TlpA disulfide reductase family protein [Bryobacteraceae bacterium]|nr:TlpA disulfide reductase family protein [Bryobacteraceae bacterium]